MQLFNLQKVGQSYWVFSSSPANPEQSTQTRYSQGTFSGGFHQRFFDTNNAIVRAAHEYNIDISDRYAEFVEQGFRVSQQLNGRVRDRTLPKYEEAERNLIDAVVTGVQTHFKSASDGNLDAMLSDEMLDGVSDADRETIAGYVAKLKHVPLSEFPEVRNNSEFNRVLGMYVFDVERDARPSLDAYSRVPAEARAEYLKLTRLKDLEGGSDWFNHPGNQEELANLVEDVSGNAAKSLFKAFRYEIERDRTRIEAELTDAKNSLAAGTFRLHSRIRQDMPDYYDTVSRQPEWKEFNPDQKGIFYEFLLTAQELDLPHWRDEIPLSAAELLDHYQESEVREIAATAFELAQKEDATGKEIFTDLLDAKLKENTQ